MSSIIRRRSGVMTRSFAEVDGVETTLIMAQRERAVSTVKRMIGDEAERREKGQEELKRKENRRAVRRLRLRASSAQRFSSIPYIRQLTAFQGRGQAVTWMDEFRT